MHPYHQEIWNEIQRQVEQGLARPTTQGGSYIGTSKPCYSIRAEVFGRMGRDWLKRHPDLNPSEYLDLLNSLSQGESHEEFAFVGLLLRLCPALRKTLDPQRLDIWLDHAEGWAEVDSICQSNFAAEEVLSNWKAWKNLMVAFSKSDNVHKRRASLVLLSRPLRESADPRFGRLAFANIGRLKHEKDILITKAVSWLLRALIKYHRREVEAYLKDNADTLPKIAVRETRNKLQSGRKSGY